jgi:hypothetical protein
MILGCMLVSSGLPCFIADASRLWMILAAVFVTQMLLMAINHWISPPRRTDDPKALRGEWLRAFVALVVLNLIAIGIGFLVAKFLA